MIFVYFFSPFFLQYFFSIFSGYLLQLSTEASYGFTAGAIAFLVINTFLMLIGNVN